MSESSMSAGGARENGQQSRVPGPRDQVAGRRGGPLFGRPRIQLGTGAGLVAVLVVAVHWPALSSRVRLLDDDKHVYGNVLVQAPGWHSVVRFFGEVLAPSVGGYYKPLSMTSLMLDRALATGPLDWRPYRRTSLALHAANTVLVIVLLFQLFGHTWTAVLSGMLYGVHPLTVETIPWAAERKTLLAALFSLGCMILYVRYCRRPRWSLMGVALGLYVLALLSKPTAVPLVMLLLVLDYWPLRRLHWRTILEKIPLLALACASGIVTLVSQRRTSLLEVPQGDQASVWEAALRACHNVVFYLGKVFWPAQLSAFYAIPERVGLGELRFVVGLAGTGLLLALLAISWCRTRAFVSGWLFFFLAIFPTLGVIGFTNVIAADRFVYFPMLGLLLPLAWYVRRAWGRRRAARVGLVAALVAMSAVESYATRRYLAHWRDSETLFRYMIALAPRSFLLPNHLGGALLVDGRLDDAAVAFRRALELNPDYAGAHSNLAIVLARRGQMGAAIDHLQEAVRLQPHSITARYNLALTLARAGRRNEAIHAYREVLRLRPDHAEAERRLAALRAEGG